MKKLITAIALLSSLTAFGVAIEDSSYNPCSNAYNQDAFGCALSTTFSLPVLLIADTQVKPSPAQAQMMVLSEIESGETVVTEAIAASNNMTVEEVQAMALESL